VFSAQVWDDFAEPFEGGLGEYVGIRRLSNSSRLSSLIQKTSTLVLSRLKNQPIPLSSPGQITIIPLERSSF